MQRIVFSQGYECKKWQRSKVYATHPQPSMRACPDGGNNWQLHIAPVGMKPQLYPHVLILLPSTCTRGEGLGVRGFALCFDCFLIVNSMSSCVLEA